MRQNREKLEDLLFTTAAIIGVSVILSYAVGAVLKMFIYLIK